MNEFKQLLDSELLNEDTKTALNEAIESFKENAITSARSELEVEFATKLVEHKETISSDMTNLIMETVKTEIEELKEDIAHYKEIEPEYARKLQEFKDEFTSKLSESFTSLVTESVAAEIDELREDLVESKNNKFGMDLYESFKSTFETLGVSKDEQALQDELKKLQSQLKESVDEIESLNHQKELNKLLDNLSGSKREIMATILESVKTDKLESRYNETIESVLKESVDDNNNNVDDKDDDNNNALSESDVSWLKKFQIK